MRPQPPTPQLAPMNRLDSGNTTTCCLTAAQGLGRTAYEMYAADLGLDLPLFSACLDEGRYDAEVNADQQYAVQLGIQSTPTFFINGIALIGAQPFEVFEQVIDQELAGKLIQ